jgi:hypothetical protein
MARRPVITWIVVVALIAAIAIWLGYAYRVLQPDSFVVAPSDRAWLIGIVLLGCALDLVVMIRLLRGRNGVAGLTWLALRGLLSIVGFLFVTFPSYAIAFVVLSRAPRPDPRTDPDLPHAYRPISAGWFGALTPLWWSRTLVGARQIGESQCIVCRQAKDDAIHGTVA